MLLESYFDKNLRDARLGAIRTVTSTGVPLSVSNEMTVLGVLLELSMQDMLQELVVLN